MSFSVNPKDSPTINPLPTGKPSARDRAIAKLTQASQEQASPTQNPPVQEETLQTQAPATNPDTIDTPVAAEPAATQTPAADPLAPKYALLAREQRALRQRAQAQEAALKAKEAALAEREAAMQAKEAEYTANYIPKSRFKADPLSVLTEEGVSYDEITKQILNPTPRDPQLVAEIEALKVSVKKAEEAQAKQERMYQEQQQQAYDNAVAQIRYDAKRLVQNDPEFSTIKNTGAVKEVVDLITKTYHEDKVLLTVEEAAKEVEDFLVERIAGYAKIDKIQAKLNSKAAAQAAAPQASTQAATKQTQQPTMKTLTNAVNASKPMSARERAIAAFRGELK